MYERIWKRFFDFALSFFALIVLSPALLLLTAVGAIAMWGNPFFTQLRPGKKGRDGKEKIFRLIKFRTMTCKRDAEGRLLPDEKRLTGYGRFLRSTSLDELPELLNIMKGDMAIVGPRPLLVNYLTLYNEYQARRHEVRPGLTGLAQINGRNATSWEVRFGYDVYYVDHVTLAGDLKIIFKTIGIVLKRDGINSGTSVTMEEFMGTEKKPEREAVSHE